MNRVANMNETELESVAGGMPFPPTGPADYTTITVHKGCGGKIIWYLFEENVCEKCGEHHFWMRDFDTETIRVYK